jgi:DNA-binding CsgD family transcriptional regulator
VLALGAEGVRYREIAGRLSASARPVRFQLETLRRKAGVASRAELVWLAREQGWIG